MADKLIDMALTGKDREAMKPGLAESEPAYPWGLRLTLSNEALAKLGLNPLPNVDDAFMLHAQVEVVGVQQNEGADGVNRSIDLQITACLLERMPAEEAAGAAEMYPSMAKPGGG
jgi:hypothetical protein